MYRYLRNESIELEHRHLEEITATFPDLAQEKVIFKDDGLVYDLLIINNSYVFRFPKYDWSIDDMFRESACLQLAGRYCGIQIPEWQIHDDRFVSYRKIMGHALTEHEFNNLDPEVKETVYRELGTFLKSLHGIPKRELKEHDIKDSMTRHDYNDWMKLYDDVQQELYRNMTASARDAVDALFRVIIADYSFAEFSPRLIHGDLGDYHILFDSAEGKLSGIIDFSSSGLGDPATDIACLLLQYGEAFVGALQPYYRNITKLIDRARFIAGTLPLQWALGGVRTGDNSWFLVHLGKRGSIYPIGSPLSAG